MVHVVPGCVQIKTNSKYASYVTDLVVDSVAMVRTILYIHEARKQPMHISTKTETFFSIERNTLMMKLYIDLCATLTHSKPGDDSEYATDPPLLAEVRTKRSNVASAYPSLAGD